MKQLIIIRHAKSSWDFPVSDFDRNLLPSGVTDAKLVAKEATSVMPESYTIWSSAANRATQTAQLFAEVFNYPIQNIEIKKELYTFNEKELERIIRTCPNEIENLVVFGHNEAITNFVNKIGNIFIDNVATSGFVSIILDANSWKDFKTGITSKVIFPKQLR
jgi:phosphohistidine phosphatase